MVLVIINMKKICLIFLFLISFSASFYGEEGYAFKELYEIEVELNGSDRDSINEGMKLAFKDLMLSLSSNSEINTYPAIAGAVRDSEKYISEYRLSSENENILAVFSFNGEVVRKLLSDNNLPMWLGIKPKVLLFLPCKSDSFLMIDHQEILVKRQEVCSEVKSTLSKQGSMRNIVFIEPVLDLIDLKYINLYEPRLDQEFLNKISSRYGLKDWMICYIQNEYGIFISEFLCLSPVSGFKKISLNSMVDLLADELSKDFQLNIDDFGRPDWSSIDPRTYPIAPAGMIANAHPLAPIITTRGCPYSCTYCSAPITAGKRMRYRDPKNVVDEIEMLVNDYGVKEIQIEDDNFTLSRKHCMTICEEILKRDIKVLLSLPNGVRIDKLDKEMLLLLKKS